MASRKPVMGGNWKMNLHSAEADALVDGLVSQIGSDAVEVFVSPAFVYLKQVADKLAAAGSPIRAAAQDFYHEANGAFTGEVSTSMLQDIGLSVALVGHSERRHVIGETDVLINQKTRAALAAGIDVVLCIGEKLEQREAGQTNAVNIAQLHYGLAGVSAEHMSKVVIAYEPVWAIGTGKSATPDDAQSAHAAIRAALANMYGQNVADATRIQYGGSVKPASAVELFSQPDIDGFLVGGASLKADDFAAIVQAADAAATA